MAASSFSSYWSAQEFFVELQYLNEPLDLFHADLPGDNQSEIGVLRQKAGC
jgi:hypothetical protein